MNAPQPKLMSIEDLGHEEAEAYVIGACLLDGGEVVRSIVKAEHFKFLKYQHVMEAIESCAEAGIDITIASVQSMLKAQPNDNYNLIGGLVALGRLRKLARDASNSVQHEQYAEEIKRLAIRRNLAIANDKMRQLAFRADLNIRVIETEAQNILGKVFATLDTAPAPSLQDAVSDYIDHAELAEQGKTTPRLTTGFPELDSPAMLGGFKKGDFVVIGGDSSMGKTSFAVSIAGNMRDSLKSGLFLSMEMDVNEMAQRFVAAKTGISLNKLKPWAQDDLKRMHPSWLKLTQKTDAERRAVIDCVNDSKFLNIGLKATPTLTALEVWSEVRRFKIQHGKCDFVIVDLITNLTADEKDAVRGNRATELQQIAGTLKEIATKEQIVVIALSQISGALRSRTDKRPMEGDFRDSAGIGFQADVQLFIYRDHRYNDEADPFEAEILIRKHRGGATGTQYLRWHPESARFLSQAQRGF